MFNKSPQYDTNNFAIIGSFTRSFDTSHNENNRIHLISSICLIKQKEMDLIGEFLNGYKSTYSEKMFYVFIISPNLNKYVKEEIYNLDNLVIIRIGINVFLENLIFTDKSGSLFENIFGSLNLKSKDFDVISQQSVFIFLNQMWSNILLNFKINKVDVSGGSISKRHILHSVDYQLVLHLLKIFDESKIMSNIVYNSLKDPILSSSIPLNYYKIFLDRVINISNMKVKDIYNISSIIIDPSIYSGKN